MIEDTFLLETSETRMTASVIQQDPNVYSNKHIINTNK